MEEREVGISEERLAEIEARHQRITPDAHVVPSIDGTADFFRLVSKGWTVAYFQPFCGRQHIDREQSEAEAEFAFHSRQDIPDLVAEVRRLRIDRQGCGHPPDEVK